MTIEWIATSDQEPEHYQYVLAYWERGSYYRLSTGPGQSQMAIVQRTPEEWMLDDGNEYESMPSPSHWMPLPERP